MTPSKAVPVPTPETAPFWDAARREVLELQRCEPCDAFYFYPRPVCPRCSSTDVRWESISGRARLHSYLIAHTPAPGFESDVPYAVAVVRLDEGPMLTTNLVDIEATPEALVLDMALEVTFVDRGDLKLPVFRPASQS